MFVLRRITANGHECNDCLNDSYHLILKESSPTEFEETEKIWAESSHLAEIYGFVVYNKGRDIIPLYFPSSYFIMTGDGKTFANITWK